MAASGTATTKASATVVITGQVVPQEVHETTLMTPNRAVQASIQNRAIQCATESVQPP